MCIITQICLFDKYSTQMFWYNVQDKSSTWASDCATNDETAVPTPNGDAANAPVEPDANHSVPIIATRKQRRTTVVLSGMQRAKMVVQLRTESGCCLTNSISEPCVETFNHAGRMESFVELASPETEEAFYT